MKEKTKRWIKAAGIRAARTMAQAALASIGTTALITGVNWRVVLSTSAMAGVWSILTSIVTGLPEVNDADTSGRHFGEG